MIRNLKTLGPVLVVVLAIGAVAATAAVATAWEFHIEKESTRLNGLQEGEDIFEIPDYKLECDVIKYHGESEVLTQKTLKLKPTYEFCLVNGIDAEVHTESCGYTFHAETTENGKTEGSMSIECKAPNDEIKVTVDLFGTKKCTVHVPPQGPIKGVTATNVNNSGGATREITFDINLSGITYKKVKGTGFGACAESGLKHDGKYTGTLTVEAEENPGGKQTGIWVS